MSMLMCSCCRLPFFLFVPCRQHPQFFIECFLSFGAEMQAVPLPLLPHCSFFLFFLASNFWPNIQGSDRGLTASSQLLFFSHFLTHGCTLQCPSCQFLSKVSQWACSHHFTVLSAGCCSVSPSARETSERLFQMTALRNKHQNDVCQKRCAWEIKQSKDACFTSFCYERVPVCISQSVSSTLPDVISVNRCWQCLFARGNRRTLNSLCLLTECEDPQAAMAFQTAHWNAARSEVAAEQCYYYQHGTTSTCAGN